MPSRAEPQKRAVKASIEIPAKIYIDHYHHRKGAYNLVPEEANLESLRSQLSTWPSGALQRHTHNSIQGQNTHSTRIKFLCQIKTLANKLVEEDID